MRLLIVSYYFPPAAGGGVQRVLKFAKYLPQFGVDVEVLAPDDPKWVDRGGVEAPADTVVHRTRYLGPPPGKPADILQGRRGLDRAWTRLKLQPRRILVPDLHAPWTLTAAPAGRRIVRQRGIDAVLSTSPPETDHVIGRRIARATGVPWIADLRDSWLDEPGLRLDSALVRAKHRVNHLLSARTVGRADHVLTVSDPISDEIRGRYPHLAREHRVSTLMNGVDLDDFVDLPAVDLGGYRCTITYTGNFFGRRSPRPFLAALDAVLERRPDLADLVRVRFVGSLKPHDEQWLAAQPRLAGVVKVRAFTPYRETLALQRGSDALLLAIASGSRHAGEVTGKLFEYVAARRPVLAVVPADGAAARFLRDLGEPADTGVTIADPDDHAAIAAAIERTVDAWRDRGTPDLPMTPRIDQAISRRARAEELAQLLHRLVDARKRPGTKPGLSESSAG